MITSPQCGVLDVAQQVLAAAGVVEADDRRAGQRGAAEREEVVGGVVEQHRHVQRAVGPARRQRGRGRGWPSGRLGDVLAVGPDAVLEADRRPIAALGIGGVAAQQRRGVGRRQRRLTGRGDGSLPEAARRRGC